MQSRQVRVNSNRNGPIRDHNYAQLAKLQQNVHSISQKNKEKYQKIIAYQPDYHVELYQPKDKLRTQKAFKKQLLLKQLDRLMDQQNILDKKLAQINFVKQVESQQAQKMLDKQINHYRVLRTVWAKHEKNAIQSNNSDERLDSLNFTIGIIKNTIVGMRNKQEQYTPISSFPQDQAANLKYQNLLQKLERSLMLNQQLRQQINSLYQKLHLKEQNEKNLHDKIIEKQKQIKALKKSRQAFEIDYKFEIAKLRQELYTVEKKLQNLEKWKSSLSKNQYENKQHDFKLYVQVNSSEKSPNEEICKYGVISKTLPEIERFLIENTDLSSTFASMNPQFLSDSKFDQENSQIIIPSLNLIEKPEQVCMRKKISTDRPLKAKNFEFEKFVGSKLGNMKYSKLAMTMTNLNDESMKKFVRKTPILGTSRRLQPQYSERTFQTIAN